VPGKKLHIVILSTWYPVPGRTGGMVVRNQADALIDNGHKVGLFMCRYFSLMVWLQKKLKGEKFNIWVPGRNIIPHRLDFVRLLPTRFAPDPIQVQKKAFLAHIEKHFRKYIKQNGKPDVIHHHGLADYSYITYHLHRVFNIPYVITEHSMFIDKVDHFTVYETEKERQAMIENAACRIAVSTYYAAFNSKLFGVPFITLPNMINNDFADIPLPAFPKKTKPFYFLNIGQLRQRKRQDILIRAFAEAFKGSDEVRLIIAGTGELEGELNQLIASLGIQEQVQMAGYKDPNEIIALLDNSNVVVISSEKESFSMAAAEALYRGNPVLTTRCGGPEDFINERNGLTCQLNDVSDMKDKLVEIYNRYATFNPVQLREDARSKYSEKVIAAKLEEVYENVISSYQPAGKDNGNR